jgi:hypothetical protein
MEPIKFILIVLFVKELVISPPWAASAAAEFDDLAACEAAADRLKAGVKKLNAQVLTGCMPKSLTAAPEKPEAK